MKRLVLVLTLITTCSAYSLDETIFVDAVLNAIGDPNVSATYVENTNVQSGVAYDLTITGGTPEFNTGLGGIITNVGVVYVEPPRKMKIGTIELNQTTCVITEGNLRFFFVDNPDANSGGFTIRIKDSAQTNTCQAVDFMFSDGFE